MPLKSFILRWDETLGVALVAAIFAACLAENLYAVSTLMDTSVGTYIQYVVASVAVVVEALGLIKMREAYRNGKWAATGGMLLLTALAVTNSVANELTFYNVNYANKSQSAVRQDEIARDLGKEKAEIEKRLASNANIRPVAAIEADIALALSKKIRVSRRKTDTLGNLTRDCMNSRADAYDQCGETLTLRGELANAVELIPQIAKDKARLEAISASGNWVTSVGVTHPGAHIFVTWYNAAAKHWGGDPIDDETGMGIFIVITMLAVQAFNLVLPFSWFCGENEPGRVECSVAASASEFGEAVPSPASVQDPAPVPALATAADTGTMHPVPVMPPNQTGRQQDEGAPKLHAAIIDELEQHIGGHRAGQHQRQDDPLPVLDPPVQEQDDLVVQSHLQAKTEFSLSNHDPARVEAVRAFIELYCRYDACCDEVSADIHDAYRRATSRKLAYAHRQFTAVLRQVARQPIEILQIHRKHHLRGIRLNDAGRRLLIKTGSHRRAAMGEAKMVVAI